MSGKGVSQNEREDTQKRTFTKWINLHLNRSKPSLMVHDLFSDIKDGKVLMALLEELSGCKMLYRFRPYPHRIFRLSNVAKVLNFLEDRNVRLISIDASDIVDGNPSAVLGLIWNIIVFFQIKEVTGKLHKYLSSTSSLSSLRTGSDCSTGDSAPPLNSEISNTLPSNGRKAFSTLRYRGKAINILLHWVQRSTAKYGVEVCDFGKSWRSGLAFLALIKSVDQDIVDMTTALSSEARHNVEEAFKIAQENLGILPLLDPEDVIASAPDEQSIITYVSQFLECYRQQEDGISKPYIYMEAHLKTLDLDGKEFEESRNISPVEEDSYTNEAKNKLCYSENNQVEPGSLTSMNTQESCMHHSSSSSQIQSSSSLSASHDILASSSESHSPEDSACSFSCPYDHCQHGSTEGQCSQCLSVGMRGNATHSQSSEEGVYTLSVLDLDEEEAYSYILELNQDEYDKMDTGVNSALEPTATTVALNPAVMFNSDTEGTFEDIKSFECEEYTNSNGESKHFQNFSLPSLQEQEADVQISPGNQSVLQDQSKETCNSSVSEDQHTDDTPNATSTPAEPETCDQNVTTLIDTVCTTDIFESDNILDRQDSSEMDCSLVAVNRNTTMEGNTLLLPEENHITHNGITLEGEEIREDDDTLLEIRLQREELEKQDSIPDQHGQISTSNEEITEIDFYSQGPRVGNISVGVSPTETEELHLLLFLWILLYCVLMLPQLEL